MTDKLHYLTSVLKLMDIMKRLHRNIIITSTHKNIYIYTVTYFT